MLNLLTISGFSDLLLNCSHHWSGGPCSDQRLFFFSETRLIGGCGIFHHKSQDGQLQGGISCVSPRIPLVEILMITNQGY